MFFVCAFYAISWSSIYVYVLNMRLNPNPTLYDGSYYVSVFIAFLYTCTNPFVYAAKFDPVEEVLLRLIPCKTNTE